MKRLALVVAAFSLACAGTNAPEAAPVQTAPPAQTPVAAETPVVPAASSPCPADVVPRAVKAVAVLPLANGDSALLGTEVAAFGVTGDTTCIGAPDGTNARWAWVPTASLGESPAPLSMTGNFQGASGFIRITRAEGAGLEIQGLTADNSPQWVAVADLEPPGGTVKVAKTPGCSVTLTRLGDSLLWAAATGCPGEFTGLYRKQSLR